MILLLITPKKPIQLLISSGRGCEQREFPGHRGWAACDGKACLPKRNLPEGTLHGCPGDPYAPSSHQLQIKCKLSSVLTCLETQRVRKASSRKNKYLLSTHHVPCTLTYTCIHTDTLRLDTPAVLVSRYGCVNRHGERLSNFFEVTQLIGGGARFEPS